MPPTESQGQILINVGLEQPESVNWFTCIRQDLLCIGDGFHNFLGLGALIGMLWVLQLIAPPAHRTKLSEPVSKLSSDCHLKRVMPTF